MAFKDLREFIKMLEMNGQLIRVSEPISNVLEMTEIQTRVIAESGPAILFENVIIDKVSLEIISGSVIDFKKEMIGESFVINNPKATASCGCGLSFSV